MGYSITRTASAVVFVPQAFSLTQAVSSEKAKSTVKTTTTGKRLKVKSIQKKTNLGKGNKK